MPGGYNDHYDLEESDVLPLVVPTEHLIADVSKMFSKRTINSCRLGLNDDENFSDNSSI